MATNAQLVSRLQRRAASLTPEMRATYLRAFRLIRDSLTTSEWTAAIQSGQVDALLSSVLSDDVLASGPLAEFRSNVVSMQHNAGAWGYRAIPKALTGDGRYNPLAPQVADAVGALSTRVVTGLGGEVRETVRQHILAGMEEGLGPRTISRGIRDVVGLAPNQEEAVRNFRRALEAGDMGVFRRKLRDRRFDRTLRRAMGRGGAGLSSQQVNTMTEAYRRRWIAWNAETQARSFTLDAQRQGQRNAWASAADDGLVDRDRLTRTWVDSGDDRVRPEHAAMNGETVPFDQPYSNGQMVPGETDYNCRCTERYSQRRS